VSKDVSNIFICGGLLMIVVQLLVGHQIQREQIEELRIEMNELKQEIRDDRA